MKKSASRSATRAPTFLTRLRDDLTARATTLSLNQKRSILLAVDICLTAVSYVLTLLILAEPLAVMLGTWTGLLTVGIMLLISSVVSVILKIPNIRLKAFDSKGIGLIGVLALISAAVAAALHQIGSLPLSVATFVVFGMMMFVALSSARLIMLEVLVAIYRMRGHRTRVLIYGAGATGIQLARALTADDQIEAVAFVDDNPSLQGLTVTGLEVLRPVDIDRIVAERAVARVVLCMPSMSRPKQTQLARRLQAQGLEVQVLPSFTQLIGQEPLVEKLVPMSEARLMGRQVFDRQTDKAAREFAGRSVLVSGGGGSIGSELCRQLLDCAPRKLIVFELSELALYEIHKTLTPLAADAGIDLVPILGSVTEGRLVRHVIETHQVDVVLHAAAYKHVSLVETNPLVGLANNVLGTSTLAREAARAGCERFVLVSSDKAVRPTNIMGASKRLAELVVQDQAARSRGTIFTMVRFGNVIGSSGSVIPLFKEQIAQGGPVTVTHRDVTRFFMTVEEAVSLVLMAGSMAKGGEVYVLDMGKPVRIWDLARHLIEENRYTVRSDENPDGDIAIVEVGLKPGEKLREELIIGEGHVVTMHEKIFVTHEASLSEIEVASALRSLREALSSGNEEAAAAVAMRWVEGYRKPGTVDTVVAPQGA
ncbi:NDP-sugar epimerase, includes UDP-GlcNAc-inverting 4,6-dehydratase FlaA1 and capsular polysaccharide biosynthesis protein EpsC [Palleronia salina]|uniref:NDP-sugar epimerase, includes UDP-GlcNAc-inverting 4,6-dehydratase FlaA1 and capsular polysaccharide biosynthesis protein EpsC n=1 Tax=Palleronia salina TaxID=313368 RepID=A0A1M6G5Q2_9RHOB|nr:NDP-sugar epimerase, includes UDP-GlcNAc-inverting 4,6-dehydratase FlaA1 and capsular polysaccharide biosynthesis protein EpsC [Palleronia salina]